MRFVAFAVLALLLHGVAHAAGGTWTITSSSTGFGLGYSIPYATDDFCSARAASDTAAGQTLVACTQPSACAATSGESDGASTSNYGWTRDGDCSAPVASTLNWSKQTHVMQAGVVMGMVLLFALGYRSGDKL